MSEFAAFVLDNMPSGVIVFSKDLDIKFCSKKAIDFLNRFGLPQEITNVSTRIFQAMNESNFREQFPGDIYITKQFDGSHSKWTFRINICDEPKPLVIVYIIEEAPSDALDLNKTRQQFKLTRGETDVLRRVLDGLPNTDIAEDLQMTEQTVKYQLDTIYVKTGVKEKDELIRFLLQSSDRS
jgi:DNA-binding CsgD family transcriptional regulator